MHEPIESLRDFVPHVIKRALYSLPDGILLKELNEGRSKVACNALRDRLVAIREGR